MRMITNQSNDYKCVFCTSADITVIRDGPDPKLKCNKCGGTFQGSLSRAAEDAGALTSSPETLARAAEPETTTFHISHNHVQETDTVSPHSGTPIPRLPKYVFISKSEPRTVEFVAAGKIKQAALRWESHNYGRYDIYELTPRKSVVRLDIS